MCQGKVRLSLVERLQNLGYDEIMIKDTRVPLYNCLKVPSEAASTHSAQVQAAGALWAVCMEHEEENPIILSGRGHISRNYAHDRIIISIIKSRACHIWLDIVKHHNDRWPDAEILQLSRWIFEACESLAMVQQYSAIYSLIERVKKHILGRLMNLGQEIRLNNVSINSEKTDEACMNFTSLLEPLLFIIKLQIWGTLSSMKANVGSFQNDLFEIDCKINGWSEEMADSNLKLQWEFQCYCLKMDMGMHFMKAEEYDQAMEIFFNLVSNSDQIQEKLEFRHEIEGASLILKDILEMDKRLLICLLWSHACQGKEIEHFPFVTRQNDASKFTFQAIKVLRQLEDPKLSKEAARDIQIEFADFWDDILEKWPHLVNGVVFICSKLMVKNCNLDSILITYVRRFQETRGYREKFLLGILANVCKLSSDSRFSECSKSSILVFEIISNKLVSKYLQTNLKLTLSIFNLVWNLGVESVVNANQKRLFEAALILAEILQNPELIKETLYSLSHISKMNDDLDLALHYARQLETFDPSKNSRLLFLEIMACRSEIEIESMKNLVEYSLESDVMSLDKLIYLVCTSLEMQNFLMAGIWLHAALQMCLERKQGFAFPGMVPIIFQNFLSLTLKTSHPYLMRILFQWMNWFLANSACFANEDFFTTEDQKLHFKKFIAYEALNLAFMQFNDENYACTKIAAFFASSLLEPSLQEEMPFLSLLGSQICFMLGLYVLYYVEDHVEELSYLTISLKERSCRIKKHCPEKMREHLERLVFYEKYLVLLHHLHDEEDSLACETWKSIESYMCVNTVLDILFELVRSSAQNLTETTAVVLQACVKMMQNEAIHMPELYIDILRVSLQHLNKNEYIQLVEDFHLLHTSVPKNSFPYQFMEWIYTSCWNFAMCQLKHSGPENPLAKRAMMISLEGFQRAQIFCKADLDILKDRAHRLSNI